MEQETAKQVADAPEAAPPVRLNFNVTASRSERLKELADYAAHDGLIPSHPRGNMTSFVNWCLILKVLWQYILTKRGFCREV